MAIINGTDKNDNGTFQFTSSFPFIKFFPVLNGTSSADTINGFAGTDILNGNGGNDLLNGGTGADKMNGGDQNDTYIVDNVGDVAAETFNDALGGVDTVNSSVTHTLGFGIEHLTLTGSAAINGTGNANNNTIKGNSGNNTIDGKAGADTMDGGDGSDTYIVDNVGDKTSEIFNDLLGGVDTVLASASHTIGNGIEHLTLTGSAAINGTGNANNNTIKGNSGNNTIDGKAGADTMDGGDGSDTYIVDNVGDKTSEIFNDLLGGVDTVLASASHTIGNGIEHLTLTGSAAINGTGNANNNTITGNSAANVLSGLTGNDTLRGGSGNDTLNGGTGADTMDGGDGSDTYIVDNVGDKTSEIFNDLLGGVDTVFASASHTIGFGIEHLTLTGSAAINGTGNANNNTIKGNSGNNVLTGGTGKDTLTGGGGFDTFDYNAVSASGVGGDSPVGLGRDIITDFRGNGFAAGDQIDLRTIDANILVSGNQAFTFIGNAPGNIAFTGVGQLRFNTVTKILAGNIDGDALPEFEIQLLGSPALFVSANPLLQNVTDILL